MFDVFSGRPLVQLVPSAVVVTNLYTVPATIKHSEVIVIICNTSGAGRSFRLSIALLGAADNPNQYIYFDFNIPSATNTMIIDLPITLNTTDVIRCRASGTGVAFTVFGIELIL